MKKPDRIIKLCEGLSEDVENIRRGMLDQQKATTICRHVNAIVKAESVMLQYDRISERESRLDK